MSVQVTSAARASFWRQGCSAALEALLHPKTNLRHVELVPFRASLEAGGEVKIPKDWRPWNPTSRKGREKWGTHLSVIHSSL